MVKTITGLAGEKGEEKPTSVVLYPLCELWLAVELIPAERGYK